MPLNAPSFDFDIFVSYAHRDDHDGWVEAFVDALTTEHARFTPTPLRLFFDRDDIQAMHDWEHRILRGLRGSKIMLALLSPHYFDSPYCRKEWEIYIDHELDRALPGQGIAPIYVATEPGFEDEAAAALDHWLINLKRRQYLDIRLWREHGPAGLQHEDAQMRIALLDQQITEKLQFAEDVASSPTNAPPHNRNFAGRVEELRKLRETLALGRVGTIAVLHGLAGIGKSALAFEYAHAYASEYPGGRFVVSAAGVADLRIPIINLADLKGVELTEDERQNLEAAFARVRAAFESGPRSLLVLDGVDEATLLSPAQRAKCLPASDNVHILATTRLEAKRAHGLEFITIDALPEREALALLEKHRPFENEDDRAAAGRIVARLGGHTLAMEVVAVYLWQTPEVSYSGYAARVGAEGLGAVEGVAMEEGVELTRHHETVLSQLLAPTLDSLDSTETLIVNYAALLPPERIAFPWLKALIGQTDARFSGPVKPGYPDQWKQIERRLLGLRILTEGEETRLARMPRLTQEIIASRLDDAFCQRAILVAHAAERASWLLENWTGVDNRWEVGPLLDFAKLLLSDESTFAQGATLANPVSDVLILLGRYYDALSLLGQATTGLSAPVLHADLLSNLALVEQALGDTGKAKSRLHDALKLAEDNQLSGEIMARLLSNLAGVESDLGDLNAARSLLQRAIEIEIQTLGAAHPALATSYSNLADIEREAGHLDEAARLLNEAIQIEEAALGTEAPNLAVRYANLAAVEQGRGYLAEARALLQIAINLQEQNLGDEHPDLVIGYSNLATIERDLGNYAAAKTLLERAIDLQKKSLGAEHPALATRYSNLALVELDSGNAAQAHRLLQDAARLIEDNFGADHPALAVIYSHQAMAERDLGNFEAARALILKAVTADEAAFEPDNPNLAITYFKHASIELHSGQLKAARAPLERAIAIQENALENDHPRLAQSLFLMAQLEAAHGNEAAAREFAARAHAAQHTRLGAAHPDTQKSAAWLQLRT